MFEACQSAGENLFEVAAMAEGAPYPPPAYPPMGRDIAILDLLLL